MSIEFRHYDENGNPSVSVYYKDRIVANWMSKEKSKSELLEFAEEEFYNGNFHYSNNVDEIWRQYD